MKKIPRHIAVIPDGNRRWAKFHGISIEESYIKSLEVLESISRHSFELGVEYLTIYVFSSENWKRTRSWRNIFQKVLLNYLRPYCEKAISEGVRLKFIGNKKSFGVGSLIEELEKKSKNNMKGQINLALDYGGQQEIVAAVKEIYNDIQKNHININEITVENFSQYLYTRDIPEPDLLIRTSGEFRVSNFLLWQMAYTELYFSETFWPDFSILELNKALSIYQKRQRRLGE